MTEEHQEHRRIIWVTITWLIAGFIIGQLAAALVLKLAGVEVDGGPVDLGSVEPSTLTLMIALSQLLGYLIPGLIAAYTLYMGDWLRAVNLIPAPRLLKLGLGMLIMISALPLVGALAQMNASFDLADWQVELEQGVAQTLTSIITTEGASGFIVAFLLIAVLPALGEELVFRGLLQPAIIRALGSAQVGVWLTAFVFGLVHFQFAGILPRIFLGAVLGFLAFYSGRLWVPIVAHMLFNGSQVVALRLGYLDSANPVASDVSAPSTLALLAALLVAGAGGLLLPYLSESAQLQDAVVDADSEGEAE